MWAPICDLGKEKEIKSMKIKRKVQLNLPQLIEWVEKNGIRNHVFISDIDRNEVEINIHGRIFCKHITLKDTFTIEVEEELTEDTVIDKLIVVYSYCSDVDLYKCIKVGEFTNSNVKSIYILNDDYTTTLIWRDGKLVE